LIYITPHTIHTKMRKRKKKTNTQQQTHNTYASITPSATPLPRMSDLPPPLLKAPLLPSRVRPPCGFGTMRSVSGELAKRANRRKKKRGGERERESE
jgi:hypothetical protein